MRNCSPVCVDRIVLLLKKIFFGICMSEEHVNLFWVCIQLRENYSEYRAYIYVDLSVIQLAGVCDQCNSKWCL